MGSKGRMPPPPHLRRPLPPGHGLLHPEQVAQVAPMMHPHPGPFSPFDMLPPPQVMEQKLATQHVEMQRLATENQRLAATHGTLRQELAAAQHELQMLHLQIGTVKAEREQQIRGMLEKIGKMEAELQAVEPVKHELQQARAEAQSLVVSREELIGKAQQLNQELQRIHADVQQIPALMTELEHLRQEYQHCRDVVLSRGLVVLLLPLLLLQLLLLVLSLVQFLQGLFMMLPEEDPATMHQQGLLTMHKGVLLMTHRG
ncbi:hypothetical protein PIB30_117498 [Stylosanthes scabra]|uniref:Uncharacterized protein n=1 Tax=Stylosanthes scabra TaxID=79078 RepID=A0ABU6TGV8_9FABA|nr:hypothetical protein [Stylosanthes scabra]